MMMIVASNSITVSNVNDGTTVHIAYADSADGKDGFYVGGGTNLVSGTNQEYAMGYGIPNTTWENGYAYLKLPTNVINIEILPQDPHAFWYTLTQGVTYTQTIWFETDATVKDLNAAQITWFTWAGHDVQPATVVNLGGNKYKIYSTYTWPRKADNNVRLFDTENLNSAFDLNTGTYLNFGKLKLEEGSVSTPWCPAPSEAHPIYMGTYTDYNQADSLDPTAYLWSQIRGADGKDGVAGKEGVGIKSTTITYATSTSGTSAPTSGWVSTPPATTPGQFMWTRTIWSYTDGTNETGYSVAKAGEKGDKGDKGDTGVGIAGTPGEDGRTPYVHTAWSRSSAGVDGFSNSYPGVNLINGSYDSSFSFSSINGATVQKVTMDSGEVALHVIGTSDWSGFYISNNFINGNYTGSVDVKGTGKVNQLGFENWEAQGQTPGMTPTSNWQRVSRTSSIDGKARSFIFYGTMDVYVRLLKVEKGTTASPWYPSPTDDPINAYPSYRGDYTDYTEADSDDPTKYEWALIRGAKGNDGVAGKDGIGLKSTTITYQASTSGTTAPTGTWLPYPTATAGQYQWTRTVWNYTDGTTEIGYSVGHIGADGATGKDGIAGNDGVGIKSTTITYATSTSGTSAPTSGWVSTPPTATAGQFVWTRTIWTYTDNTTETGYSVGKIGEKGATGNTGATGAEGKSVWSYPYDRGANRLGSYWSDLKPAPTTDNLPKVGDTIIDMIGNMYQITHVVLGSTDQGGGTFDYGSLLTSIKGPQGPAGNDITSYASGTALPTTVAPANSQFWLTDSAAGVAIKFYKSTGTEWVEQQISAAAINAATFNGLSFTGVTFNGSTFASANSRVIADGEEELYTVGTTLTNTQTLDKTGYTSVAQGSIMGNTTPNSFKATTTIGNTGSIRSRADFASGDWSIITIDPTQSTMTMSNSQGISGTLDANYLSMVNKCGKILVSGVAYMHGTQTVTPGLSLNDCLNGWLVEWQPYANHVPSNTDIMQTPIFKSVVNAHSGQGLSICIGIYQDTPVRKYLYVTPTQIKGDATNTMGISGNFVLTAVYAF